MNSGPSFTTSGHVNGNTTQNHVQKNHETGTVSFVDGTPSSRSASTGTTNTVPSGVGKRDRKRSDWVLPPLQSGGGYTGVALGGTESRDVDDVQREGMKRNVVERYRLRQYIAFQPPYPPPPAAAAPTPDNGQHSITESVQREAEYLLNEGSQLVSADVRDALLRAAGQGGWVAGERVGRGKCEEQQAVTWRNVQLPCLTIDGTSLGRPFTYNSQQPLPSL